MTEEQRKFRQEYDRIYYLKNKQRILTYKKNKHIENKDKYNDISRQYYKKNKEKMLNQAKLYYRNNKQVIQQYRKNNRSISNTIDNIRYSDDVQFRLKKILRSRLYKSLKHSYKSGSAVKDLGCSISEFKIYLENKFTKGMSWENHGEWHIDHIIPLSSFDLTDRKQLLKACHYTNMQPLWAIDNMKKGNKI